MVRFGIGLLLFSVSPVAATRELPVTGQHVLDTPTSSFKDGNPRKVQGRFLHITGENPPKALLSTIDCGTDIHPDPYYEPGTNPDGEHPCHKGKGSAGYFGAEKTACDTPFSLVNATFQWIRENLKDEIDFVIWTGDSARHDNDERYPRSNKEVEQLNKQMVDRFVQVFGKSDNINDPDPTNDFVIPIIPTFGNNDFIPHNIFTEGPNRWTRKYLEIWDRFVPQEQRHSFARGGWFYSEVIPNKLAVFSLNTMYFFDSNTAVDGCDAKSEPGYEHFEWLRIQLEFLRQRQMKAILMGHVPPARTDSKQTWDETCYQKWTLWQRQYRDVIVGNFFGHTNLDYFLFQDVKNLNYKFKIDGVVNDLRKEVYDVHEQSKLRKEKNSFHALAKVDFLNELRDQWAKLPTPPSGLSYSSIDSELELYGNTIKKGGQSKKQKKLEKFLKAIGGPYAERYSLSIGSPSVVPNYYPTLRIIEYNATGLEKDHPAMGPPVGRLGKEKDLQSYQHEFGTEIDANAGKSLELDEAMASNAADDVSDLKKKKKKKHKKKKKPKFVVPNPPSKSSPPGPAYSAQTFTFLSIAQYYSNLTQINEKVKSDMAQLTPRGNRPWLTDNIVLTEQEEIMKKHFNYELEYTTNNDSMYKMKDLTIRSWVDLAEKISRPEYRIKDIDQDALHEMEQNSESLEYEKEILGNPNGDGSGRFENEDEYDNNTDDIYETTKNKKSSKGKESKVRKNKLWHTFVKRAFVSTKLEHELDDDFG